MPKNEGRELVEFSRRGLEWFCRPGGGLQQAIRKLKTPSSQRPRIVLLIGANTQRAAKEAIFKVRRSNGRGPTQVDVVESTRNTEEPLLIVTLDIEESYKLFRSSNPLSTSKTSRVVWNDDCKPSTQFWLIVTLLRQALLPFVDVACIFLDDFANHEEGTRLLNEWQEHPISSPPCAAQIIVISTRHSQACSTTHVRHLHVQSNRARDSQLHRKLASTIHESLCISRNHRDRYRISFSAIHLESLFEAALHQAKTSRSARFDYIVATRRFNKVEEDFVRHLEGFFGLCAHVGLVGSVVTTYVASALLLDSSPPGTHKFWPHDIYDSLYRPHCIAAIRNSTSDLLTAEHRSQQVQAKFSALAIDYEQTKDTAAHIHLTILGGLDIDWTKFLSSNSCLICLRRPPEHPLNCGHSMCDTCVRIFGKPSLSMEHCYTVETCQLCNLKRHLTIRLKPPTAGSRLLALDGGGIRGAITLQILMALEKQLRLPYPIYDTFDMALGASTGGLIALMFLSRRKLTECRSIFNNLALRVFRSCRRVRLPIIDKLLDYLYMLVTDSLYGSRAIEDCVKEAYGSDKTLFGCNALNGGVSGIKVGVTAITIPNSRLCILSNYNGNNHRQGYKHFRPADPNFELLVTEAARATSAAPSFFPAKFIRGLGFCQDGGASIYNSPIAPAEWEARAVWDVPPDLQVCIGTGYSMVPESPLKVPHRLSLHDRFLPRLCKIFLGILSTERVWDDHWNRIKKEDRHKVFRINLALDEEPVLDDVDKISKIEQRSQDFLETYNFGGVIRALLASNFYFELEKPPRDRKHAFVCTGSIRCRSPDTRALVQRVLEEYPMASIIMEDKDNFGRITFEQVCDRCSRFHKDISFHVRHLSEVTAICIKFNSTETYRISGFPQSMEDVVQKQMLYACFGTSDHRELDCSPTHQCKGLVRKKRTRTSDRQFSQQKRRMLCKDGF